MFRRNLCSIYIEDSIFEIRNDLNGRSLNENEFRWPFPAFRDHPDSLIF